ncbi:MAG TPA: acyltransferase [Clostridia bacterium]
MNGILERNLSTKSAFKLSGADGIRAIACLAVIMHHLSQRLAPEAQTPFMQVVQSFLLMGNTGVSVFFVLSGFLLSYPFWKQYLWGESFPSMKQYAARRAARIMPGYYLSLIVSCIVIPLLFHIPVKSLLVRFLSGFFFVAGFHYVTFFPSEINGPLWSISFEVLCYLLMPLFMYGLYKLVKSKRSFGKAILYWIGVLAFITLLNQLIHAFLTPGNVEKGWQYGLIGGAKYWMPNYNPIGFFAHFSMGIMAAGVTAWLYKMSDRVPRLKEKGMFDIIGVVSLLAALGLLFVMRLSPEFSLSIQNQPYFFPLYALLIACTLAAVPHSNWFGRLLDNPFFRYTAKVSFGLYIWHYLVLGIVSNFWFTDFQEFSVKSPTMWLGVSLIIIVISYVIATLTYYFIEKPVLDRVHKK